MSQILIASIITVIVLALFVTQAIPISITAVFGALAMAFAGIISFEDALAGYASDAVMLTIGAMTMGSALTECGVTTLIGHTLLKLPKVGESEKLFLGIVLVVCAFLSAFLSNVACVAMFLPLVAATARLSEGRITKKNTYMAIGMAAVAGGGCTLVGSTPQLIAQGILQTTEGCDPMTFFEITKGGIIVVIFVVLYFVTIGYALEKKVLDFEEVPDVIDTPADEEEIEINKPKAILSSAIFLTCIVLFVVGVGTVGGVGMAGGALCIATKCISEKKAFKMMDWTAVAILGGTLGIAKGLNASGTIQLAAEKTLDLFGGQDANPFILCFAIFLLSTALGNIVSHTATAAILCPLGISLALSLGSNPIAFVVAVVLGSNASFITPTATTPVTMTLVGGYRFMDYVKIGTPLNIISAIVTGLLVPIFYGV
ncbi:MAG: SLC13 family permease [Bacillota bacterium]|nr:SLC13 family permease [Bacillota bacterium]